MNINEVAFFGLQLCLMSYLLVVAPSLNALNQLISDGVKLISSMSNFIFIEHLTEIIPKNVCRCCSQFFCRETFTKKYLFILPKRT